MIQYSKMMSQLTEMEPIIAASEPTVQVKEVLPWLRINIRVAGQTSTPPGSASSFCCTGGDTEERVLVFLHRVPQVPISKDQ